MEGRKRFALSLLVCGLLAVAPAGAETYSEQFDYPDGSLNGVGGWTGGTGSYVSVSNASALLTYNNSVRGQMLTKILPTPIGGSTIWWHASVMPGPAPADDGDAYDIRLEDAAGNPFARWYGATTTERPRIGDLGIVLGTQTLTSGAWNDLLVVIDTAAKTSTFSLNNVTLGTLNYGSAGTGNEVARIRIGFQNAGTLQDGGGKYYDDIWVSNVPEPATLGLLALGALFAGRRRACK